MKYGVLKSKTPIADARKSVPAVVYIKWARHISASYGLTLAEWVAKWGNYPGI